MDRRVSERARTCFDEVHKLAPVVREYADRGEREAQMPREVADAFHDAGLFRMLLPRDIGGGEVTIVDSLRLCEGGARIDASGGWNIAVLSGGTMFGPHLARSAFATDFSDSLGLP